MDFSVVLCLSAEAVHRLSLCYRCEITSRQLSLILTHPTSPTLLPPRPRPLRYEQW